MALATPIVTVLIALSLGAYLFLTKKGGTRHRSLGKAWLALMGVTAVSSLFVRNLNHGNFSWIDVFTVLTLIALPQAILSARRGDIAAHRKHMRNFFLGSLVVAGAFTFIPGRTMWQWAFADRAAVRSAQ